MNDVPTSIEARKEFIAAVNEFVSTSSQSYIDVVVHITPVQFIPNTLTKSFNEI